VVGGVYARGLGCVWLSGLSRAPVSSTVARPIDATEVQRRQGTVGVDYPR
jgi:hypothetical protein